MGVEAFMEFNGTQKNANGMPQAQPAPRPQGAGGSGMGGSGKAIMVGVAALAVLVLVGLCLWMWKGNGGGSAAGLIKTAQYQAVFMTNGQVYFCKLSDIDNQFVKCNDIYYLQVQQSVQPADKNATQSPQVSLAKLGSELHGPEDQMVINRDQVLFWENLKDDGKVVKAIQDSKK